MGLNGTIRLLLIEDNPGDARLVEETLKQSRGTHFEIFCAETLQKSDALLGREEIDVILTDLKLPGFADLEVVSHLVEKYPAIPVVVLTGTYNDDALGVEAIRLGAQDYFVKEGLEEKNVVRALRYAIVRKKVAALEKSNSALHRLSRVKSDFISMASHELRTPVAIIREGLGLVLEEADGPLTPDQKRDLEGAQTAVLRLMHLIDNLLDFSRMESGKMVMTLRKNNLNRMVTDAVRLMTPLAKKKGFHFRLDVPPKPLVAVCDAEKLGEVLINLIDNAIKFADKKGDIRVGLGHVGDRIQMEVANAGRGIREAEKEKLFQMFSQCSPWGIKKTKGWGLGLAICKLILDQHQGDISFKSAAGTGTCFTLKFPDTLKPKGENHE